MSRDTHQVVTHPKVTDQVTDPTPYVVGVVSPVTQGRPGGVMGLIEEWGTLRRRLLDGELKLEKLGPADPRYAAGYKLWSELEERYRDAVLELAQRGIAETDLLAEMEAAA